MKKFILQMFAICFLGCFSTCYAGGGIAHMFVAQEAIAKIPDTALRNLILTNLDAYLVGAYYPDSGYIKGNLYGEDSHWDAFIYAFTDHLKSKYTDPVSQNPKLVAFLFGVAAHRVSDEVMHWTFYNETRRIEFNDDYEKAHSYGDTGIDLLVNIDKNLWFSQPATWWVPVQDLVQIYHRMGKDEYDAKQIIWGNIVIFFAGYGERMISAPAYPILRWKMPWTAKHYYDWPQGGMLMSEKNIVEYQTALWQRLNSKEVSLVPINKPRVSPDKVLRASLKTTDSDTSINDLALKAIASGAVTVNTKTNEDGSVELQAPVINQMSKLQDLIRQFLSNL